MGVIQRLFSWGRPKAEAAPMGVDPIVLETLRGGGWLFGEGEVNVAHALRNPSVYRCVTLISSTIGMLPLHLIEAETKEKAKDHPLFLLLHREPNGWQTAYEFRSLMQMRVLTKGNAYARVVWSAVDLRSKGGRRTPLRLIPLDPDRVTPKLTDAWEMVYEYRPPSGGVQIIAAGEMLHLRGFSLDGVSGISVLRQARDAIRLALDADLALRRLFQRGSFVGATLEAPSELSQEAYERLTASWNENYAGADNAGGTPLLEGGTKLNVHGASAKDAQSNELRGRQVEEIARVFGVPRPLLMVDETSWGSGIEALGRFFVQFALNPWFEAWQQAIERTLLDAGDKGRYVARFNPGALLRGSLKDQADYFAKALGAGGHQPWMHVDEVRDTSDLPEREAPSHPMMGHNGGPALANDEE
ncbi:phage portal protein [Antarcticirhabdus aurantiaca]|uniref:Phage portal protein n=1 Tax=Antarcticirhabdus aurantiaca TaxID=2606717 RepID=A0ACD4NR69_9HYPH|nr:phage portal protein [Jeongeuplla avenae]